MLYQLDDARTHAVDEDERLLVALVVFDAERSCAVRLAGQTAPHDGTLVIALETLDTLAERTGARVTDDPFACSAPYRVRFDEAGPDGLLRTSVLLRYAQDVAWFHSASRGFDRAWYAERGLTWLVRAAEVSVLERIAVGSELIGTTRVVGWRRVWARRQTTFRDAAGTLLARADIDWVLLDARGAPTRIPPEFEPIFGATAGSVGLARVALGEPPTDARQVRIVVRPQELDPMDHVNNAVYADWLEEAVIEAGDPERDARHPAAHAARIRRRRRSRCAPRGRSLAGRRRAGRTASATVAGRDLLRARLERARPESEPRLASKTGSARNERAGTRLVLLGHAPGPIRALLSGQLRSPA